MPSKDKLAEFTAWCGKNITGHESFLVRRGNQNVLRRLLQTFDQHRRQSSFAGATEDRLDGSANHSEVQID
jgi:hypothetical protein